MPALLQPQALPALPRLKLPQTVLRPADSLYLHSRHRGDTAGDFAVLNGGEHLVTAKAVKRTRLACFPRFAFELLTDIAPDVLSYVYNTAADLSRRVLLARVYVGLFGKLSSETLDALLDASEIRHLFTSESLYLEGDEPDGLHVVIAGRLHAETNDVNGEPVLLAEVNSREIIGEAALLANTCRTSSVYATRESMVANLPRSVFDALIMTQPELLASITRLIVQRQRANINRTPQTTIDSNYVVIPLDTRLPLRRLTQQLRLDFRHNGRPLLLDQQLFDTLYGKKGAAQTGFSDAFSSSISAWLDDKENTFSHVLYIADHEWTEWTQRCVNRADRILLVANAESTNSAARRELEEQLDEIYAGTRFHPRIELLLLHPHTTERPTETERWLRWRKLDSFHHVRLGDRQHIARLGRRLRGEARGLVLSGGGARGYAHLGVQRALEEIELPVDYIGGSSMGGLLGASMAMGLSYQDVFNLSREFANAKALFDYTLPIASLMRSGKLTRFCKAVYGDVRIEDLWVPFFCVSSNMTDGREVIHQQGDLWKAVRSTISLPGIFTPVPDENGDLLIDGAILNTFPVDVMHRELSGGVMVGVNVSQIPELKELYSYGTELSGWKLLLTRMNPFVDSPRVPRIIATLMRATDIKSIQRLNETREMLDVLVEPDVSSIALLDFKAFAEIARIGYEQALPVLQEFAATQADFHARTAAAASATPRLTTGVKPDGPRHKTSVDDPNDSPAIIEARATTQ